MNKPAAIAGASVLGFAVLGGTVFGGVKLAAAVVRPVAVQPPVPGHVIKTVTASPSAPAPLAAAPASAAPVPADPAPVPTAPALTDPGSVVTQFYDDISNGDYQAAWSLGGENIGGTDYSGWAAGYQDTTSSISVVTSSDWSDDTAYAEIDAIQDDGSEKTYEGTYTVENGVITSADIRQTS